mgnify:CR=1 FL=1
MGRLRHCRVEDLLPDEPWPSSSIIVKRAVPELDAYEHRVPDVSHRGSPTNWQTGCIPLLLSRSLILFPGFSKSDC